MSGAAAIMVMDQYNRSEKRRDALEKMLGCSPEEAAGRTFAKRFPLMSSTDVATNSIEAVEWFLMDHEEGAEFSGQAWMRHLDGYRCMSAQERVVARRAEWTPPAVFWAAVGLVGSAMVLGFISGFTGK